MEKRQIQKARIPKEKKDIWNLPPLQIAAGAFAADWESLRNYRVPNWFRNAKLGFWSHWDPQSVPEEGDWYARQMYLETHKDYRYHLEHYGHPSEFGYKDICGLFTCEGFQPLEILRLVKATGAGYFLGLANHHDNFDNFDSKYQPWNSVNVGAFRDIAGEWTEAARAQGLKIGFSYHATPGRVWGQFMPVRYQSDTSGEKSGSSYDGTLTKEDGIGTWWEGMDPADLYGPPHSIDENPLHSPFANQFMHRVNDLLKYQPDLICFDECVGHLRDLGAKMGLGLDELSPQVLANYYNQSQSWNDQGETEVVMTLKDVGGSYNSVPDVQMFQTIHQSFVKGIEKGTEEEIAAYPFQTEDSFADWHYQKGMQYKDGKYIIRQLCDVVSRNGNLAVCIPQHGDGSIDPESVEICEEIARWMDINHEAIYGSRPYEVYGEGDIRYTRKQGCLYAVVPLSEGMDTVTLKYWGSNSVTAGKILQLEILGEQEALSYQQEETSLTCTIPSHIDRNEIIVLKAKSDRDWVNDDDEAFVYSGWDHVYQRDSGNYNNDLHVSRVPEARLELPFTGCGISLYASTGYLKGLLEIRIDKQWVASVALHAKEEKSCVKVFETMLEPGNHLLECIAASASPANIDAACILTQ